MPEVLRVAQREQDLRAFWKEQLADILEETARMRMETEVPFSTLGF